MDERRLTWSSEYELPYETLWGKMEKICYINGLSMNMVRENIKANYRQETGKSFDDSIMESEIKSSPFDKNDFWKRYIYHPNLKICPVCMSHGYHSVFHQFFFTDTCFIHDCDLQIINEISFSPFYREIKAGKHYCYLDEKPDLNNIMDARKHLSKEINATVDFMEKFWTIHPHILYPRENTYVNNNSSKKVLNELVMGQIPEKPLLELVYKKFTPKSNGAVRTLIRKEANMPQYAAYLKENGLAKTEALIKNQLFDGKRALCHFTFLYVRQLYFESFHKDGENYDWIESLVYGNEDIPEEQIESVLDFLTFCCLFDTVDKEFMDNLEYSTWTYDISEMESCFGIKLYGIENLASYSRKKKYFYITKILIDRLFIQVKEQLREQVNVTGETISRVECDYEIKVPEYVFVEGDEKSYLYECMPD